MTIRQYIKIHTQNSFINNMLIKIKPYSLCDKQNVVEQQKSIAKIYKQEAEMGLPYMDSLLFMSVAELSKKVDFNIEIGKVEVNYSTSFSYDGEIQTVFYIEDNRFLSLVRSCGRR